MAKLFQTGREQNHNMIWWEKLPMYNWKI